MGVVWSIGSAALAFYGLGSALAWWGGQICYRSCDAGDTPGFWWAIAVGMTLGTAILAAWTWRMFTDRTVLGVDGIRTSSRTGSTHLAWASIERFELIGRAGFPAQVHAVTVEGAVRLRGVDVAVDGSRGRPIEPFLAAVEERSGPSIVIERRP
ncbi:MAG: hypothetical protein AAF081_09360 [Actinomycetota bacterium]